jgi:hypothetical protein
MPEEMKKEFVAQFPNQQTYYTKITTDEKGLIYVFVPDIMEPGKQEIDIFSAEGNYLYQSVIELPNGSDKFRPFVFDDQHFYTHIVDGNGVHKLKKHKIRTPKYF